MKSFEIELINLIKSDFSDILFWDYSDYKLEDYEFLDLDHLNNRGANKFSRVINSRLNKDYK